MKVTTKNPKFDDYKELIRMFKSPTSEEVVKFKRMYSWDTMLMELIKGYDERFYAQRDEKQKRFRNSR